MLSCDAFCCAAPKQPYNPNPNPNPDAFTYYTTYFSSMQAESLAKEQLALEKQVESQTAALQAIEDQKAALEAEKKGFSSRQALLEKDQRQWVSKVRTSQAALAKAIWRKPGQPSVDDDTASIFEGSVTSVRTASKRAVEIASSPSLASYASQANLDRVSDYNEILPYKPTFPAYVQHHIQLDNAEKMRVTTAAAAAAAMQAGLRSNSSSSGGSSSASIRSSQDHASQHSSATGGHSSVLAAGFRFRASYSSSSLAAGSNSQSLAGDGRSNTRGGLDASVCGASDSTVVTFRKPALLMPPAVREFLKSGAAAGLSLSLPRGGGGGGGSSGDTAASGVGIGTERRGSPIRGRPQQLRPLLDGSSASSPIGGQGHHRLRGVGGGGGGGGGPADDNHSVATMSTLGNGSFVSLAGASTISPSNLQSPGWGRGSSSSSSSGMSSKAVQQLKDAAQLEEFKRRTQPPLPKHTGKVRVNASGVGTLTRKGKTISDLLAEDEALNSM